MIRNMIDQTGVSENKSENIGNDSFRLVWSQFAAKHLTIDC